MNALSALVKGARALSPDAVVDRRSSRDAQRAATRCIAAPLGKKCTRKKYRREQICGQPDCAAWLMDQMNL
ncbi:hypothetical protein [Actinokineospora inagensis]|uniref:hypothetical protein n=1 Tax=Actinokineospora inagensis TaxID=103730 RepID=UPI00041067F3|nr:hypothetical protein [Actinokineospora inagensis]